MDSQDYKICSICNQLFKKHTLHNCPPKATSSRSLSKTLTCEICGKVNINRFHNCLTGESPIAPYIDFALIGDAELRLFVVNYCYQLEKLHTGVIAQVLSARVINSLYEGFKDYPEFIKPLSQHNKNTYIESLYHTNLEFKNQLNQYIINYIKNF